MNVSPPSLRNPVTLWCLLRGGDLSNKFKVQADFANDIDELKQLVITSGPHCIGDRRPADLILYKVNKTRTEFPSFRPEEALNPQDTISDIFTTNDLAKLKCVHILVILRGT